LEALALAVPKELTEPRELAEALPLTLTVPWLLLLPEALPDPPAREPEPEPVAVMLGVQEACADTVGELLPVALLLAQEDKDWLPEALPVGEALAEPQ
jgi:hypothetical protein